MVKAVCRPDRTGENLSMGYIHCCGGLRRTRSFVLVPLQGYVECILDYLPKCPQCGNLILQITRIDSDNILTSFRYKNKSAKSFLKIIKNKILYEVENKDYSKCKKGKFYLYYNEYGVKKRCYTNISNLKIGKNKFP